MRILCNPARTGERFLPTRKTALVSANIGNIRGATVLAAQFSSHGRGVNFVNFGHFDTAHAQPPG